ncbi:iron-siderophore ABC transporter substrate-binding protein [Myxosarcina sp. GI1(2024)]
MAKLLFRSISLLFLAVITFVLVLSCTHSNRESEINSQALPKDCVVIQHVMGETCIPQEPKRIVTLNIAVLSNALALGIQPIGATIPYTFSEAPDLYLKDKIQGIEIIPVDGYQVNLEKVLLLEPDLIVSPSTSETRSVYPQISQIAPTVLLPFQEISGDWKQHFFEIAVLFDKIELAEELMNEYYLRIEDLKQKIDDDFCPTSLKQASIKDCHQQLRVLFVEGIELGSFDVRGRGSFPGSILDDMGFQTHESASTSFSIEYWPQLESDILFIGTIQTDEYGISDLQELAQVREMPLWNQLEAVQKDRVYVVNRSVWYGSNILAAYAALDDIERSLLEAEN